MGSGNRILRILRRNLLARTTRGAANGLAGLAFGFGVKRSMML
jgi:hypothetical protein